MNTPHVNNPKGLIPTIIFVSLIVVSLMIIPPVSAFYSNVPCTSSSTCPQFTWGSDDNMVWFCWWDLFGCSVSDGVCEYTHENNIVLFTNNPEDEGYYCTEEGIVTTTTTLPPISCQQKCIQENYDWGTCAISPPVGRGSVTNVGEGFCEDIGGTCWCGYYEIPTTTVTTTTLPPISCKEKCQQEGYTLSSCSISPPTWAITSFIGDFCPTGETCWCGEVTTTTTLPTTTTTLPPTPPQPNYLPHAIGISAILIIIGGILYFKN